MYIDLKYRTKDEKLIHWQAGVEQWAVFSLATGKKCDVKRYGRNQNKKDIPV